MVTAVVNLCSAMDANEQQAEPFDIGELRTALAGLPDSPFPTGQPSACVRHALELI